MLYYICDIKISRINENNLFAHFIFGVHIPWLQIVKKSMLSSKIYFFFSFTLYIVVSIRIAS